MDTVYIQELWEKVTVQDDQQAFSTLYQVFFRPLFRFALSLTKSAEVSEEIVNDIFVKIWTRKNDLVIRDLKVYLFTSVKNQALDYHRKRSQKEYLAIEEVSDIHLKFSMDPEQILVTAELLKRIEAAIQQLPPRSRLIFMLVRQYGLKYKEVASVLELSVKTVENQLAIAMQKLTKTISFVLEEKPDIKN